MTGDVGKLLISRAFKSTLGQDRAIRILEFSDVLILQGNDGENWINMKEWTLEEGSQSTQNDEKRRSALKLFHEIIEKHRKTLSIHPKR